MFVIKKVKNHKRPQSHPKGCQVSFVCSTSFLLHYTLCLEGPACLDPGYGSTTLLLRDRLRPWYVLTGHQRREEKNEVGAVILPVPSVQMTSGWL